MTSNNPSRIYFELPRYACPELTNKPGYWAKAISEDFCVQDYIISFCINDQGLYLTSILLLDFDLSAKSQTCHRQEHLFYLN